MCVNFYFRLIHIRIYIYIYNIIYIYVCVCLCMCVFTLHCVLQSLSCWSATYALIVEPSYPIGFLFILRGPIILYGILEFARVVSI